MSLSLCMYACMNCPSLYTSLYPQKKFSVWKNIAALIQDSLHFDKLVAFFLRKSLKWPLSILFFFHLSLHCSSFWGMKEQGKEKNLSPDESTPDCLSSEAWPQTRQRINQLPLHFSNQTTLLSGISSSTWKDWWIKGCCDVAARALWLGANREWYMPSTPGGETQRGRDTHTSSGAHTYVHILRC